MAAENLGIKAIEIYFPSGYVEHNELGAILFDF